MSATESASPHQQKDSEGRPTELICHSNIEGLNAVFIEQGLPQGDRLFKLNQITIQQMKVLEDDGTYLKREKDIRECTHKSYPRMI